MKIAVIDDKKADREYLSEMIKNCFTDLQYASCHLREYENGVAFLADFKPGDYDLIFLDILMDGKNGIETASQIRRADTHTRLVFISVSNDFASESYAVHADYYLLKPYGKEEFLCAIKNTPLDSLGSQVAVTLPNGQKISAHSILYTSFSGHYVTIHREKEEPLKIRCTQKEFEQVLLPFTDFVLCTKGMIVNLNKVSRLDTDHFVMNDGNYVSISRRKYSGVKQLYSEFLIKKMRKGGKD